MTFSKKYSKPIIEAKKRNRVYVIYNMSNKASGKTFRVIKTNLPLYPKESKPNTKSILKKESVYPTDNLPVPTLPAKDEFETALRRNTRANSKSLIRVSLTPTPTSNKFSALGQDELPLISEDNIPYAEIVDKRGLYPQINKRQKNTVKRSIRKEEKAKDSNKSPDRSL
jgi:hypothetical protein